MVTIKDAKKNHDDLQKLITNVEQDQAFPSHFFQAFYQGERSIFQKEKTEIKQFDEKWIRAIESYFTSLVRISKNVKSTLRYDEEILPVEKTKKIDARSIRHLSSHTQYIRDIDENNDVLPAKVLTSQSETEYGIYENRFAMTLINRLETFVSDRIKHIEADLKGKRHTHLKYQSAFDLSGNNYELNIDLKQKETLENKEINNHNKNIYDRALYLQKMINNLQNSRFMQLMNKYKPIKPPIVKTQIILKNPDFKGAYLLWLFLDKYYKLEYDLEETKLNRKISKTYEKHIDQSLLMLFSSFYLNDHKNLNTPLKDHVEFKQTKAELLKATEENVEIKPFANDLEPQFISELFLQKAQNTFKKIHQQAVDEKPNYTIGLKSALKQMIAMTNSVYAKFFEVNQEKDLFDLLIKEDDPEKAHLETQNKYKIAKAIREVKELDYKDAIRLERKWQSTLLEKQHALIKHEKELQSDSLNKQFDKLKKDASEETQMRKREMLKRKEIVTRTNKDRLAKYRKKLSNQLDKHKKMLKTKEAERIAKEKKRLKVAADKQIEQLKQREIKHQKKLEAQIAKQKEQLKKTQEGRIQKATQKSQTKTKSTLEQEHLRLKRKQDKLIGTQKRKTETLEQELKDLTNK